MTWISEVWWLITIQHSSKKAGINLKLDNSEDYMFNWPKQPDYILIEDLKKNNWDKLTGLLIIQMKKLNLEILILKKIYYLIMIDMI